MKSIKLFFNKNIKLPFKKKIDALDAKVVPKIGNLYYKYSKKISKILALAVFPIMTMIIGVSSYAYVQGNGYEPFLSSLALILIISFFFFFYFVSIISWFYFSKWSDYIDEEKESIRREREEIKANIKLVKKQEMLDRREQKLNKNNNSGGA